MIWIATHMHVNILCRYVHAQFRWCAHHVPSVPSKSVPLTFAALHSVMLQCVACQYSIQHDIAYTTYSTRYRTYLCGLTVDLAQSRPCCGSNQPLKAHCSLSLNCLNQRVQLPISSGLWVSLKGIMNLVWAKYSLFEYLDPLGHRGASV